MRRSLTSGRSRTSPPCCFVTATIPVICYTNCDSVELFLNGKSLGTKSLEFPRQGTAGGWNTYARAQIFPTTADLHLSWDVPYEPGVLKAVGYRERSKAGEVEVRTAGEPSTIVLAADHQTLQANTREVAHLTVKVVDARGDLVPGADNLITFNVQGAGSLVGVDNGDPASHEDYKAAQRKTFNGLCLAIIQTTRESGRIRVTASADGLMEAVIELNAQSPTTPSPGLP